MKLIYSKYFKIFLIMGAAYFISSFSIDNLFLADSIKVNPFAAKKIASKINNIITGTVNYIVINSPLGNTLFNSSNNGQGSPNISNRLPQDVLDALATASLTKISQGVYAGEKNNVNVLEIRTAEIDFIEYVFNVNGKEIKIKVPKDQQPPNQQLVEKLYE